MTSQPAAKACKDTEAPPLARKPTGSEAQGRKMHPPVSHDGGEHILNNLQPPANFDKRSQQMLTWQMNLCTQVFTQVTQPPMNKTHGTLTQGKPHSTRPCQAERNHQQELPTEDDKADSLPSRETGLSK